MSQAIHSAERRCQCGDVATSVVDGKPKCAECAYELRTGIVRQRYMQPIPGIGGVSGRREPHYDPDDDYGHGCYRDVARRVLEEDR